MSLSSIPGGVRITIGKQVEDVFFLDVVARSLVDSVAETITKQQVDTKLAGAAAVCFHVQDRLGLKVSSWAGPAGVAPPVDWWVAKATPGLDAKVPIDVKL